MKKIRLLFPMAMSVTLLASGCSLLEGSKQQEAHQDQEQQQEQLQKNEASEDSTTMITVKEPSIWSQEDCEKAIKFAQKIVGAIKDKDLEKLSTMIRYPITVQIGASEDKIEIKNKDNLLTLRFENLFTDEMCTRIIETTNLFCNWQGFMLGNGEIWFYPDPDDHQMKIGAINRT